MGKFVAITTLMGLSLSYCLHLYHGDRNLREVDCNGYVHGKGLDKDGKPFQEFATFYPYYLCEHVQPSTKLFHFVATFNGLSLLGRSVVGRWQWSGIGLAFLQVRRPHRLMSHF